MIAMNKQFVDVDFQREGRFISRTRPRRTSIGSRFKVYEADADSTVYPRSQWDEIAERNKSLEAFIAWIKNQGNEGSCACNASAQCFEIAMNMSLGRELAIQFSPITAYRHLSGGPNQGTVIDDNLEWLATHGTLPSNIKSNIERLTAAGLNAAHVLANTGYYQTFPVGWETTAKLWTAFEWRDIASFDGLVSAIFDDQPVCYGRDGHAICGIDVKKSNGVWYVKYANSWGDWGEADEEGRQGYGWDSESKIARAIAGYGAWALRAVKTPEEILKLWVEHALAA